MLVQVLSSNRWSVSTSKHTVWSGYHDYICEVRHNVGSHFALSVLGRSSESM